MNRQLDREIQGWRRRSAREQLGLLWEDEVRGGVTVISYWHAGPWSSAYVISATENVRFRGTMRALAEIDFGERSKDATFLTHQDFEGPPPEVLNLDAREARIRLRPKTAPEREDLCDLLISIGTKRDEIDILRLRTLADHEDRVVRYTVLGMLSWNPEVGNDQLVRLFGEDEDPLVRDLARRFGEGSIVRATRGLR